MDKDKIEVFKFNKDSELTFEEQLQEYRYKYDPAVKEITDRKPLSRRELFEYYARECLRNGKNTTITLHIHMPDDSTETIINTKVFNKVEYVKSAYNSDLVHNNNSNIYIIDYEVE